MNLLKTLTGQTATLIGKALNGIFKNQPVLELPAVPDLGNTGGVVYIYLRVHNPRQQQIHVRSISVQPPLFQVWKDRSLEACVREQAGREPEFILDPGGFILLPLLAVGRERAVPGEVARITLSWRLHRHPQRWQPPAWIDLTRKDYDRQKSAG